MDVKVDVLLDDCLVGTLAETADHRVSFAYSDAWLESGFAISPFSLPVEPKIFVPSSRTLHGLWGVFADSLPDEWGRLLVDRMLKSRGLSPANVTLLERLAIVGSSGMGALTYRPAWNVPRSGYPSDWDALYTACQTLLNRGGCQRSGYPLPDGRQLRRYATQGHDKRMGHQIPHFWQHAGGRPDGKRIYGLRICVRHFRAGDEAHALPVVQRLFCRSPV